MFERRKAYNPSIPWLHSDTEKLLNILENEGFNSKKLLEAFPGRTLASIRSKTRKLRIKHDLFGESYRKEKMDFTEKYAKILKPNVVFEAYCGAGHQSKIWTKYCKSLFASDKGKLKDNQFTKTLVKLGFSQIDIRSNWRVYEREGKDVYFYFGDVVDAAIDIRANGIKVDILDLDTCGSTLPILPMIINLIKPKYLMITHGEFHSMRFSRDDVLRRVLFHRDINSSCKNLTVEELSTELDKAVKVAAFRSHNETKDSYWAELIDEEWLGSKVHGMLRRLYKLEKASATADCLNKLID